MTISQEATFDAKVMLVEDDPDDAELICRIIDQFPLSVETAVHMNGADALDYLRSCKANAERFPELVLLDLNMSAMDGYEFLRRLRQTSDFAAIPVCVFTTSADNVTVKKAYAFGANAVVSKVASIEGMRRILGTILDFWFKSAKRYYVD